MSLLQIRAVTRWFPDPPVQALDGIDLELDAGQIVSIVGPSGCGKSTLLRIIAGLDTPTSGSVEWAVPPGTRPVALMPQRDGLFEWLRVDDNVAVAARLAGHPKRHARRLAHGLLTEFELDGFARAWPTQLSGGMRSRVAFLRTMLAQPALMALDEPFGALDSLTRGQLQQWLLAAAADRELTILLVTHDVAEAVTLSDRVLVMSPRPGRIIADVAVGLADRRSPRLAEHPDHVRACARVRDALLASNQTDPTKEEQ